MPDLGGPDTADGREPKKLILCFDGTGNTFSGSNADTNVVKILNKLDRNHPNQLHYYQTGIGTYDVHQHSVDQTWFGELRSSLSQTIDQGFGTTFDAHVMAGYRFLMRYYEYAWTPRRRRRPSPPFFLPNRSPDDAVTDVARATGRQDLHVRLQPRRLHGQVPGAHDPHRRAALQGQRGDGAVRLPALPALPQRQDGTRHVRREGQRRRRRRRRGGGRATAAAVGGARRGVGLWAHLLPQGSGGGEANIKEVWFPGGGGPAAAAGHPLDARAPTTPWQRLRDLATTRRPAGASPDVAADPFQASDVPLAWMVRELELVARRDPAAAVKWAPSADGFKRRFHASRHQALRGVLHDSLRFGHGAGFCKVLFWRFLEWVPLVTRWELVGDEWINIRFPLNKGDARDIPRDAVLHQSLVWRLHNDAAYSPRNNHGAHQPPCLNNQGIVAGFDPVAEAGAPPDPDHQTYTFSKSATNGQNGA